MAARKSAAKKSTAKAATKKRAAKGSTAKSAAKGPVAKKGLSVRGYAAHRKALGLSGGSPAAVQKALNSNRISRGPDGKIHPEVADAEWEANSDTTRRPRGPSFSQSKAIREAYLAKTARLDYLERVGELVRADDVSRVAFARGRALRDAVFAAAARCASAAFAAARAEDGTIGEVEAIFEAELREALRGLVK